MSTIAPIIHSTYGMYLVRFVEIKSYDPKIKSPRLTLKMIKYDYIMFLKFAIYIQIEILAMGNQDKCVYGLSSLYINVPNVLRKCSSLFGCLPF